MSKHHPMIFPDTGFLKDDMIIKANPLGRATKSPLPRGNGRDDAAFKALLGKLQPPLLRPVPDPRPRSTPTPSPNADIARRLPHAYGVVTPFAPQRQAPETKPTVRRPWLDWKRLWERLRSDTPALMGLTVLVSSLLVLSVVNFFLNLSNDQKIQKIEVSVNTIHNKQVLNQDFLDKQQRMVNSELVKMRDLMKMAINPPAEFQMASDAFRAGRYFEAESGFRAYAVKYPDSPIADKALHNATVAAAVRGDCQMANSYAKKLKSQHPYSPFIVEHRNLALACRGLGRMTSDINHQ